MQAWHLEGHVCVDSGVPPGAGVCRAASEEEYGDKKTALAPEAEVSFVQANATQPGLLCMGPA